jgi:hypothetical protein
VEDDLILFFNGSKFESILVVFLNNDDGKLGICLIFLLFVDVVAAVDVVSLNVDILQVLSD